MSLQPTAEPFQWPIAAYMILAGTSAGAVITGAVLALSRTREVRAGARPAFMLGAVLIGIGFPFLILDLERPQDFVYILLYFNPKSVISWGARGISLYFGLMIVVTWLFHEKRTPSESPPNALRKVLVIAALVLAFFVGLYPGYVLHQGVARPLWSQNGLPYLFLVSGVHMGLALVVLARLWEEHPKYTEDPLRDDHVIVRWIDAGLIGLTVLLFVVYFYSCVQTAPEAAWRLTRGSYGILLWGGVAALGWVLPILDIIVRGARSNLIARCLFVLLGGACLRILVIHGGQGASAFIGS